MSAFRISRFVASVLLGFGFGLLAVLPASAQDKAAEYPAHTPEELVAMTAHTPAGLKASVTFVVRKADVGKKGTGRDHVFLDSMEDYRDPHSLNVNVFPHSAERLHLNGDPKDLVGKSVTVSGVVRRVRIHCQNGCPQDASAGHYYQTQMYVREGDDAQIEEPAEK
ncbi:MAG: hypothetical protein JSS42_08830 [Proteobacteria bacterium]|nr:hypothetical protein [Pseudomonadota bacterium]